MKQIIFQNFSKKPIPKDFIEKFSKRLRRYFLKNLRGKQRRQLLSSRELIIVFVGNEKIQELNRTYRKKDYITDILSFSSEDRSSLGELILSPAKIRSQARLHRMEYRKELMYLLIHGVLHLLGYDHEKSRKKAKIMFGIQDEAFECLSHPQRRARK